ncbi:MAG: chromosomal replication initiator protein DnaA [bacterium]|nr:chromosomal replication initiator protein DnaA [bacterium]
MPKIAPHTDIWNKALVLLKAKVSKPGFETWLKTISPISFDGDVFTVGVSSDFAKDWLEKRSSKIIEDTLRAICNSNVKLKFVVADDDEEDFELPPAQEISKKKGSRRSANVADTDDFSSIPINSKYTFDTFVIGNSNRFAQAASLAVAKAPATMYNPLFIYGGVGLGKTHLMHAIGNYVYREKKNSRVIYVSAEKFTNDVIASIREERTTEFRNRYRNVDIWLVDDIQFIAGKDRTQEEFFHTFNTLHETNKQIVITSDRPPSELHLTDERLRSRLKWGLTIDIQPPDFETRIAILQRKAQTDGLDIPGDVTEFIANNIANNIRELEGALIRVTAFSSLTDTPITTERAAEVLKDILPRNRPKEMTIQNIQKTVAEHFNIKLSEMKSTKRTRTIVFPRQIAMYLCREMTEASLPDIGGQFGGKDHSTVIHACSQIKKLSLVDENLNKVLKTLTERLKN